MREPLLDYPLGKVDELRLAATQGEMKPHYRIKRTRHFILMTNLLFPLLTSNGCIVLEMRVVYCVVTIGYGPGIVLHRTGLLEDDYILSPSSKPLLSP